MAGDVTPTLPALRRRWWLISAPLVVAVAALGATRGGVGVTVDSGEYLAVAESLREGRGLTMPYVSYDEPYRVPSSGTA